MNLVDLHLNSVGPFKEISFNLSKDEGDASQSNKSQVKHLIITGENGTGKSIIIDAIRTIIYGHWAQMYLERNIINNPANFKIVAEFNINREKFPLQTHDVNNYPNISTYNQSFNDHICRHINNGSPTNFILDYWNSKLSTDTFTLNSLELLDEKKIFINPLSGVHKNVDVVKSITFFDYLKDSSNEKDAAVGKFLFDTSVSIFNSCINDGYFLEVSRKKLAPVFIEFGNEIGIDKLSSGSIYIMQRMLSLLTKAYAAYMLNPKPIEKILAVKGLLLIDEAETHLHPKWQKVLFKNILAIFPNLQIIASTHSPFIVSSLDDADVIVCKAGKDGCYIENETENYINKPIEEILRTPLFETDSFSTEISNLLKERKEAIAKNDVALKRKKEAELIEKNPEYFKYLNIDNL